MQRKTSWGAFCTSQPRAANTAPATCCSPSVAAARPASWAYLAKTRAKVVYSLSDPDQYVGQRVLVVGGGDSALEAACSIAEAGARAVTLSYRSKAFTRARKANRARLERHADAGTVSLILNSQVSAIERERVSIATPDEQLTLDNDAVVICAGGELPTPLLRNIGIELETKYGTR